MTQIELQDLERHVSTEIGVSDYLEVDQDRIQRFADLTEDWQWIHVDVVRAGSESPQQATVAHGFLTLSFLSRFLNAVLQVRSAGAIISCGLSAVRFITPVPAGSRIRGRVRMRECSAVDDSVQVTWRIAIERDGQHAPCCVADWIVRYERCAPPLTASGLIRPEPLRDA